MAASDPNPDSARPSMPQRKRNTGRRRAAQRSNLPQAEGTDSAEPETSTDDDLFELLGVADTKPAPTAQQPKQQPGLIQLSKESMEAATKKNNRRNKNQRAPRTETLGDDTPASSEPDQGEPPRRNRRAKKDIAPKAVDESASADKRPLTRSKPQEPSPDSSYDMSSLSRSLPASFFAEAQEPKNKSKDKKWDMPTNTNESPTGAVQQALTVSSSCFFRRSGSVPNSQWQQQLQNEMTPSKNARGSGRRTSKAPNTKAGGHDRRVSLDSVPVSGIAALMNSATKTSPPAPGEGQASSPGKAAVPVSAFDSSIPFHTGFNVHRAPQTPMRAPKRSTAVTAHDGVITLPIVGDFPRINRASAPAAPFGGIKYAGPTFHNSPASGSLPKPDLDDF